MVEYQPGVCNIGPAERSKRRAIGYLGFLGGLVVIVAVAVVRLEPLWLLASAAPFYAGFIGVLQARSGFCTGFGLAGVYDVSEAGEERRDVTDAQARKADRRKSLTLQFQAAGLAVALAVVFYAIGALLA